MTRLETFDIEAGDGRRLQLVHATADGRNGPDRGPVLLVHGAGVRADIFLAPTGRTIVDALLADGYDPWLLNWRASIDLPACEWVLDDAAVHDHPAAVAEVRDRTGADRVQAIVHCQGSTSFVMSAVAGLLPDVSTIVSNAVSLHPVIPWISEMKLRYAVPLVARSTPYMNPQWGLDAPGRTPSTLRRLVRLTHHECANDVCKMVSFTYGTGFPLLWSHELLDDRTHDWISGEFADVPMTFFRQMDRCVRAGHLVSTGRYAELPRSLVSAPPATTARFAFFTGAENRCFLPESQRASHAWFDTHDPGRHTLHVLPRYSHLDVFIGRDAGTEVFPLMLKELT